jgi:hypothetical protein
MGLQTFDKKNDVDSLEYEAPDGGWGWIVAIGVAALFVSNETCFTTSVLNRYIQACKITYAVRDIDAVLFISGMLKIALRDIPG